MPSHNAAAAGSAEEGYVKFSLDQITDDAGIPKPLFADLEHWRSKLREMGCIGMTPQGIGFGNLSVRAPADSGRARAGGGSASQFFITGSATGGMVSLATSDYALVIDYDLPANRLSCRGLTKASSESMSHAAVYGARPDVHAVCHIHHAGLWGRYRGVLPTTGAGIQNGTPEMAMALASLAQSLPRPAGGDSGASPDQVTGRAAADTSGRPANVIVMGGHEEGLIAFGESLEAACRPFLELLGRVP